MKTEETVKTQGIRLAEQGVSTDTTPTGTFALNFVEMEIEAPIRRGRALPGITSKPNGRFEVNVAALELMGIERVHDSPTYRLKFFRDDDAGAIGWTVTTQDDPSLPRLCAPPIAVSGFSCRTIRSALGCPDDGAYRYRVYPGPVREDGDQVFYILRNEGVKVNRRVRVPNRK